MDFKTLARPKKAKNTASSVGRLIIQAYLLVASVPIPVRIIICIGQQLFYGGFGHE